MATPVRHVLWDWNGTLLDDLDCAIACANVLLAEYGLPLLASREAYRAAFRFPISDYYAELGFDTGPGGNFVEAAHRYVELYEAASPACGLHRGATEALAALQGARVEQLVVSASEQSRLDAQVEPLGVRPYLSATLGISDVYAASKLHLAEDWLRRRDVDPDTVLVVGDSEHDHEMARHIGARAVLFAGGHRGPDHLGRVGVPVIHDLREVVGLVDQSR